MPDRDNKVIVDTSTLIALSNITQISTLNVLYNDIFVTDSVREEFGENLPEWIKTLDIKNINLVYFFSEKLGSGESEIITAGIENPDFLLVLDDLDARKTAKKLNLKFTGLLGILIKAKRTGLIESLKEVLTQLEATDFRIAKALISKAIQEVGEG
jgi:predicted nucleic acid-binding protein